LKEIREAVSDRGGGVRSRGEAVHNQTYQRADAFLFGRRTYELFAGSWGTLTVQDAPGWESVVEALNTRPKYVASTTFTDPAWSDTTVLSGDVAAAVRELKARPATWTGATAGRASCRCGRIWAGDGAASVRVRRLS
jgi:hypothetical protein